MGKTIELKERKWYDKMLLKIKDVYFIDMEGNKGEPLGKLAGNALVAGVDAGGDSLRALELGRKLYKCEDFDVTNSDIEYIKKLVEISAVVTVLGKGQIHEMIIRSQKEA